MGFRRVVGLMVFLMGVVSASADSKIDPDLHPRMQAEEVEHLVAGLSHSIDMREPARQATSGPSSLSVRCTRADRLGAFPIETGEFDTRIVWVVEMKGEDGSDGAFYVLDDETGAVLAHGVVAGN